MSAFSLLSDLRSNLWPIFSIAVVSAALLTIVLTRDRQTLGPLFLILFSMATLGSVAGFLVGISRAPSVAAVLPSVLTLAGGIAVYIFSSGKREVVLLTAAVILILTSNLLIATICGAKARQEFDDYRASAEYRWKKELDEAALQRLRLKYNLIEPATHN